MTELANQSSPFYILTLVTENKQGRHLPMSPYSIRWRDKLLELANLAQFAPELLGALNELCTDVGIVFANKRGVVFLCGVVHQLHQVVAHINSALHNGDNLLVFVAVETQRKIAIIYHLVYGVVNLLFDVS